MIRLTQLNFKSAEVNNSRTTTLSLSTSTMTTTAAKIPTHSRARTESLEQMSMMKRLSSPKWMSNNYLRQPLTRRKMMWSWSVMTRIIRQHQICAFKVITRKRGLSTAILVLVTLCHHL